MEYLILSLIVKFKIYCYFDSSSSDEPFNQTLTFILVIITEMDFLSLIRFNWDTFDIRHHQKSFFFIHHHQKSFFLTFDFDMYCLS